MSTATTENLSVLALGGTILMTAVHHVFRMGPSLILPFALTLVVATVLMWLYRRIGRGGFLVAYAVLASMIVLWFGIFDGLLDHVLKAVGAPNVTFLPGSDAAVVDTLYTLWSQDATTLFYEGSGVLTALLCIPTVLFTAQALVQRFGKPAHRTA